MSLAQLFYAKQAFRRAMRWARHWRRQRRPTYAPYSFQLESLEPRLLMSASPATVLAPVALTQDGMPVAVEGAYLPPGTLIHGSIVHAEFTAEGETDTFTLSADVGHKLTIALQPVDLSIRGQIEVFDPTGVLLGSVTANSVGGFIILENMSLDQVGGTYSLKLAGLEGTGNYDARVWLNTSIETESFGGVTNDTVWSATDLNGSAVDLQGSATRLAILGQTEIGAPDYFSFSAQVGQSINIGLTSLTADAGLTLEVLDGTGIAVATGSAEAANFDYFLSGLIAPADSTYYVRVSGEGGDHYSLVVTRGAEFEREFRSLVSTIQDISVTGQVLGSLSGAAVEALTSEAEPNNTIGEANNLTGSFIAIGADQYRAEIIGTITSSADEDYFRILASPGDRITLDHIGNSLADTYLYLYNHAGVLLAANDDYYGLNSHLTYTVGQDGNSLYAGEYFVHADAYGENIGSYSLTVTLQTPSLLTDTDTYLIRAMEGDTLVLATITPGGGVGEPSNVLDPRLVLRDPSGQEVSRASNGAFDGPNEVLSYSVPVGQGGAYRVEVRRETSAGGDYILSVVGATGISPEPVVLTAMPSHGSRLAAFPSTVRLSFSEQLYVPSIDAADLLVNGQPADSVTMIDGDTVEFVIASRNADEGVYSVTLASGALQSVSGRSVAGFAGSFEVDTTGPKVIATSIQEGAVVGQDPLTIHIQFDEDVVIQFDDNVLLLQGPAYVIDQSYDAATHTLTVSLISDAVGMAEGDYSLTLLPTVEALDFDSGGLVNLPGIHDTMGNLLDNNGDGTPDLFVLHFSVGPIALSAAIPTPLEQRKPEGSLVYQSVTLTEVFSAAGDIDVFTQSLVAGQTLTVCLTPEDPSIHARVEIIGVDGSTVIAGLDATGPGVGILLQTVPVVESGTYAIRLTNLAGDGAYHLTTTLNSAVEAEQCGGAANDTLVTAQDLAASAIGLQGTATRLAVTGMTEAGPSDYYRFDLDAGQAATVVLGVVEAQADLVVELYDGDEVLLATGSNEIANSQHQDIRNFVAPIAGPYYIRISGEADQTYTLVVIKAAEFDRESNSTTAAAQDISVTGQVLGSLGYATEAAGAGDGQDHYLIRANAGDVLTITTSTPDGDANTLNPKIELFRQSGTAVLASDLNGAGDGRNARIVGYTIPATGVYRIVVSAESGAGEYTLHVTGATGMPVPFSIASQSVPNGELRASYPTTFRLDLSEPLNLSSVQASDLQIQGPSGAPVSAGSVTILDQDTIEFAITSADSGDGFYTATLAAGAVTDLQGQPNTLFTSSFVVDHVGPRIVAQTPATQASSPWNSLTVTFSEPINPAT
ncbi:MAG: pre-peptidase C-terminal domain-containing protein, partial [Nitrospira sp.]|nr:pre-peptidase C-terminal domain-containing protein [Nitrospira sp.]